MTRDEAVARIQRGIGFRSDLTTEIKNTLEEVRLEMETGKSLPWFLRLEDEELALALGSQTIALPEGFIRVEPLEPLRYTAAGDEVATFIPWKDYGEAFTSYQSTDAAGPKVAVLRQSSIYVFPPADIDYTLLWTFYAHSDPLNGADIADHPWLVNAPQAIWAEAGMRIAGDIRDDAAAAKFQDLAKQARDSLARELVARDEVGMVVMGANN